MLPRPEDFKNYPPDTRERMCKWNDAFTTDESARQDRLVDNEIKQSKNGLFVSVFLFATCIVCSLLCFIMTKSPYSFLFLSVPVVSIIGQSFRPVFSQSSRDEETEHKKKETSEKDKNHR